MGLCRKRKKRPDRGSNPGLPHHMRDALPLSYPAGLWRNHQLQQAGVSSVSVALSINICNTPVIDLFLRLMCVFRGEEIKPTHIGKYPCEELANKTRRIYGPGPYVLGIQSCCGRTCCQPNLREGQLTCLVRTVRRTTPTTLIMNKEAYSVF